jgi:hypothetical protein
MFNHRSGADRLRRSLQRIPKLVQQPLVSWLTECPAFVGTSAKCRVLFDVQHSGDIGSPRVRRIDEPFKFDANRGDPFPGAIDDPHPDAGGVPLPGALGQVPAAPPRVAWSLRPVRVIS